MRQITPFAKWYMILTLVMCLRVDALRSQPVSWDHPDGTTQITLNGLVSGGPYQLIVEAEDGDGMINQGLCEFEVNFAPNVTIDNCPGLDVNIPDYTFNWTGTDPEGDSLEYQTKLDTGMWSGWDPATSLDLLGLASGTHTFYVRARDITNGQDQTQCTFDVNFGPSISNGKLSLPLP